MKAGLLVNRPSSRSVEKTRRGASASSAAVAAWARIPEAHAAPVTLRNRRRDVGSNSESFESLMMIPSGSATCGSGVLGNYLALLRLSLFPMTEPLSWCNIVALAVEPHLDGLIVEIHRHPASVLEQKEPHAIGSIERLMSQRPNEGGAKRV